MLSSGQKSALEVHEAKVKTRFPPAINIEQMEEERVPTIKGVSFMI
jgi:hypothetical protein